jgi:hypothetical protein
MTDSSVTAVEGLARCAAGAMTVMNELCTEIDCYYTKRKEKRMGI